MRGVAAVGRVVVGVVAVAGLAVGWSMFAVAGRVRGRGAGRGGFIAGRDGGLSGFLPLRFFGVGVDVEPGEREVMVLAMVRCSC